MIEWNEVINVNIASRRCCQGVPLFRLSHLSRCAGAQLQYLFVVMPSMNHVEFSPLWRSQRAQNRMVKDEDAASEARFTLRDDGIHRFELCRDLASHRVDRQAFRHRHRRRFDSAGHVTQSHDDESA